MTGEKVPKITVRKRVARFGEGYVERNRLFLHYYPRALSSSRFRVMLYRLPLSRFRMAWIGRFFRQLFEAWTEGDYEPTFQLMDPAAEFDLFGLGTYRGPEGMRQAWTDWQESFHGVALEVSEVIDNRNGQIASVTRIRGKGIDTGLSFSQPGVMVWTTDERLMGVAARVYSTKEEALAAAGLTE